MSTKQLRILHTNDLHSQLENWSAVVAWIKKARFEAEKSGEDVLLFDIGDHADRVHPMTEGLRGKGNVVLLNKLNYDAVTIGNNEGMTFTKEDLNQLYDDANFQVVLANLFHKDGDRPHWVKPYQIFRTKQGIKVGVIGITAPFYTFYHILGWRIDDPVESIRSYIYKLRPDVDFLICLSHLGLTEDEKLAELFPELDLILGAHTHHVLPEGKKVNECWINQAGRSGKFAGNVKITFKSFDRDISINTIDVRSEEIDLKNRDLGTEKELHFLTGKAETKLERSVTFLEYSMTVDWYKETPLIKLLAEGVREWCQGEIGMVNAGVLLGNLTSGNVTYQDIHRICPHPINPVTVIISGEKLLETIRQAQTKKMVEFALKGFGFRGKILGAMIFDGLTINESVESPISFVQDKDILIHGESLSKKRLYKLATLDMFTFGHLYPAISSNKEKKYYMPEFLRDILAWKLQLSGKL
ncbi:bifunctional metallophosphatase/5'-nucleotidase [Bacillus tamaricis]|uniref:Bifunctional metallophosphatase/5'-nucleotidase n=1 Tax=Evansella tamaricis TaxID=2069301 RepID=A0ABS6JH44_9BACI|nr:bifunctional UDP-sugar hydrolase/5'-nucleotidase [Evansella tamaricis]MBU9712990.1 bifunctional metallophosphatase/5'-nucleotidase [Evansella tamaricis]